MGIDTQTITVIVSILIPTLGGFTWMIHRMDSRFEKMEARMDMRFKEVDARFEKVDNRMNSIEGRISSIENKLTAIDMRTSFIERLLEMFRLPQVPQKEIKKITDP
ncbi:MAG: hypothetical protein WBD50_04480 [Candidatus Rhabdochlamydia sp.]